MIDIEAKRARQREATRRWRARNPNAGRLAHKRLKEDPKKFAIRNSQYAEWKRKNPEKVKNIRRKYKSANKEKIQAKEAVKKAVRAKKLIRKKFCESCFKKCNPEAHHYKGYAKENRLKVKWLCKSCHESVHHS